MTLEFRRPNETQDEILQTFGKMIETALVQLAEYEINNFTATVSMKLQEAMHWFQSGVLQDFVKKVPKPEGQEGLAAQEPQGNA